MKLRFCGVRGSTPAPGAAFTRFGGHTSCVAVTPEGADAPRLLLDAGTGIRTVTALLGGAPFRGTILLSHLHWDHLQGLPFFAAGDREGAEVALHAPVDPGGPPLADVLRGAMAPPHFPIGPDGLRGRWLFEALDEGTREIEGLAVSARAVPHKGGLTFGYRIEDGTGSFAYIPDHRPAAAGPGREAALDLARGVDLLVHDAQFVAAEQAIAEDYGHATVDEALLLAEEAGVGELVLFHHGPDRTDDQLDAIREGLGAASVTTSVAVEGVERVGRPAHPGRWASE